MEGYKHTKEAKRKIGIANSNRPKKLNTLEPCPFCGKDKVVGKFMDRHKIICIMNPNNIIPCVVCGNPVKWKRAVTCSRACSNKYFRSGENNGNWKADSYRKICFEHHEKKCVLCGERKIVAVHHYDGDRTNNSPVNLVPLCPTHHQYMHSKYRDEIKDKIEKYIKVFNDGM